MITYRATLDLSRELVQFVARLLAAERRRRGTPRGSRALTCLWQAVLGVRWFRDRATPDALARDHRISRATAYRYRDEVIDVLAGQAPDLRQALQRAHQDGLPHLILDGTIIESGRCREPALSARGEVTGLWYSGKAHAHGGNIQAVFAPDGFPLWAWPAEPGSAHYITAARARALPALCPAAAAGLPALAGPGDDAAGTGIHIPVRQPPGGQDPVSIPAPATPCSGRCAAWANAGSPCSPAAGGRRSTSPSAPARSAASPARPWSSPMSGTATSPKSR